MTIIDSLLTELDQEAVTTARVVGRVPQEHLDWRPHPKSMSLGQLAWHIATLPGNVAGLAVQDTLLEPPAFGLPAPARTDELVPALTASIAQARALLGGLGDAAMAETWRMARDGRELLAMPRGTFVRAVMLNHWYHHRGQLQVYLRLLDVPVPSVYGPTADENPFQTAAAV